MTDLFYFTVYHMFITCLSRVYHMVITVSRVYHMFITCSSRVHHVFITCLSHVYRVFIACLSRIIRCCHLLPVVDRSFQIASGASDRGNNMPARLTFLKHGRDSAHQTLDYRHLKNTEITQNHGTILSEFSSGFVLLCVADIRGGQIVRLGMAGPYVGPGAEDMCMSGSIFYISSNKCNKQHMYT